MDCLFCGFPENDNTPDAEKEFICSKCVQRFLSADQEELLKTHSKAIEKGYPNKARAIESFLILEETDDRETKKPKRGTIRKKPMRVVGPSPNQIRT